MRPWRAGRASRRSSTRRRATQSRRNGMIRSTAPTSCSGASSSGQFRPWRRAAILGSSVVPAGVRPHAPAAARPDRALPARRRRALRRAPSEAGQVPGHGVSVARARDSPARPNSVTAAVAPPEAHQLQPRARSSTSASSRRVSPRRRPGSVRRRARTPRRAGGRTRRWPRRGGGPGRTGGRRAAGPRQALHAARAPSAPRARRTGRRRDAGSGSTQPVHAIMALPRLAPRSRRRRGGAATVAPGHPRHRYLADRASASGYALG